MHTIDWFLEARGWDLASLAERVPLALDRLEAICDGRWTPSPEDRRLIAAALGVAVDEISWGHTMNPRNVRYRRFGLRDHF